MAGVMFIVVEGEGEGGAGGAVALVAAVVVFGVVFVGDTAAFALRGLKVDEVGSGISGAAGAGTARN